MASKRKMPPGDEPFLYWVGLDEDRTYRAVAQHYDVDPAQVTRRARRERWKQRLEQDIEPRVLERAAMKMTEDVIESLADIRARQAAVGKELQERGLEALRRFDIVEPQHAIRAVEAGAKLEREAREMANKRVDINVEHTLKERFERFVSAEPAPRLPEPCRRIEVDFGELEDELTEADIAEVDGELEAERDE